MADETKTLRVSEVIMPFGVGAVVDILGESLMAPDASSWPHPRRLPEIQSDRLVDKLPIDHLYGPPANKDSRKLSAPALQYQRFPLWLVCQDHGHMTRWTMQKEDGKPPTCHCGARLLPMRFILVCERNSHADDVPWKTWVHATARAAVDARCQRDDKLRLVTLGRSESIGGIVVRCDACGASRALGELYNTTTSHFSCRGKQPWQFDETPCDSKVAVVQRGATNVHFSEQVSALDIPSYDVDDPIEVAVRGHRIAKSVEEVLSTQTGDDAVNALVDIIASDLGLERSDVLGVLRTARSAPTLEAAVVAARAELLSEESLAFERVLADPSREHGNKNFIVRSASVASRDDHPVVQRLGDLVPHVVLADKLREVRALTGFRRYSPEAKLVPAHNRPYKGDRWLPAVEGFGEGIFVGLDLDAVEQWELSPDASSRVARIEQRRAGSRVSGWTDALTPRYVLVHTLSHLLMKALAFNSGYPAASLRERLYADGDSSCGFLIYTTGTDAFGTLGGLVRQGEQPYFGELMLQALETSTWCSNDPLCGESPGQGVGGLNLAACHACTLASETSCEAGNLFLDRTLVTGSSTVPGYFENIIQGAMETVALRQAP